MNTSISYSGLSSVPDDYTAPDGALDISLNLIHEDGALRPVQPPRTILTPPDGFKPLVIHATRILLYNSSHPQNKLIWANIADIQSDRTLPADKQHTVPNAHGFDTAGTVIRDTAVMGNMLLVATDTGIFHFLWDSSKSDYTPLGTHLPEIDVEFALANGMRTITTERVDGQPYDPTNDPDGPSGATPSYDVYKSHLPGNKYYRGTLDYDTAKERHDNKFHEPFLVRFAYRLTDGSHTMASPPVLMIPNSRAPFVEKVGSDTYYAYRWASTLLYRILSNCDSLKAWKDVVTHLDIFVTPQVDTTDTSTEIDPSIDWGVEDDRPLITSGAYVENYTLNNLSDRALGLPANNRIRFVPYISAGNIQGGSSPILTGSVNESSMYITGHLSSSTTYGLPNPQQIRPKPLRQLEEEIAALSTFFKVASIPVEDLQVMRDFSLVYMEKGTLEHLPTLPLLKEDYNSHATLAPRCLFPYNSRLNLTNMYIRPFGGFHVRTLMPHADFGATMYGTRVLVQLVTPDGMKWVSHEPCQQSTILPPPPSCNIENPARQPAYNPSILSSSHAPRYLFYPDTKATRMVIILGDGSKCYDVNLREHPGMNGAFWFGGMGASREWNNTNMSSLINKISSPLIPHLSKIYTSEVNNPMHFPATGVNTIGSGAVLGLSSAAKALSQGQFGQFPLYAFTTDGVWALEVAPDGGFSSRQPITRDVCINPDGITQIDSAVLFPTSRGIMLLQGSSAECITDGIANESPLQISKLEPLATTLNPSNAITNASGLPSTLSLLPFSAFLKNARLLFDYTGQRIHLYNPNQPYGYIFSLRSKRWGMIQSTLVSKINSYPDALAVDSSGKLVGFPAAQSAFTVTSDSFTPRPCLLVTRPLKLDAPDALKSIRILIQRGAFKRGHVSSLLFGAREISMDPAQSGSIWHLLRSSVDERIASLSTTPCRYFRIALLAQLAPYESISSASVEYTLRYTSSIR